MIGSIVTINDRDSDLYCNQGEVINLDGNKATVMILSSHVLNFKPAWDCIVASVDIDRIEAVGGIA